VKIVLAQRNLWPTNEQWDEDPLALKAKPTTKTLKRIIVECGFVQTMIEGTTTAGIQDIPFPDTGDTTGESPAGHDLGGGLAISEDAPRDGSAGSENIMGDDGPAGDTVSGEGNSNITEDISGGGGNAEGDHLAGNGKNREASSDILVDEDNAHEGPVLPLPDETPVARYLQLEIEGDTVQSHLFSRFMHSKHRVPSDAEVVEFCQFAVNFSKKWFQTLVTVEASFLLFSNWPGEQLNHRV
jgi:hypothetical protein